MSIRAELNEKEIIGKLLAHYEYAIKEVEKTEFWYRKIDELGVDMGICYCARKIFGEKIYNAEWMSRELKRQCDDSEIICRYVRLTNKKEVAIYLLQQRIDFLKNSLKESE